MDETRNFHWLKTEGDSSLRNEACTLRREQGRVTPTFTVFSCVFISVTFETASNTFKYCLA